MIFNIYNIIHIDKSKIEGEKKKERKSNNIKI